MMNFDNIPSDLALTLQFTTTYLLNMSLLQGEQEFKKEKCNDPTVCANVDLV